MSVVDKLVNFMKINDDEEEGVEYSGYGDDADDDINEPMDRETVNDENKFRSFNPRQQMKGKKMATSQDGASVCVFKPTNVSESREITQTLRANKTVVLNLEDADDMSAQRILDFTSGSCFALDGTLQKISNYIFIVTPASVDISGDLQDTIAESFGL